MKNLTSIIVTSLLLLTAGCKKKDAADAAAPAKIEIPECEAFLAAADKFVVCDKLDPAMQKAYRDTYTKRKEEVLGAKTDDAKKRAAEGCKQGHTELIEGAKFRGCPL